MLYLLVPLIVCLIAAYATFRIGFSKENQDGNPEYVKQTKSNWTRLILIYCISTIVLLAIFFRYV